MSIVDPLCYLATPYTRHPDGIEAAFQEAAKIAARLMLSGMKVYSPIAHTHPLAIYGGLDPLDHSIWMPFDQAMMDRSDVLIVAHMYGWQESYGVAEEIRIFEEVGKPIFDLNPETLSMSKRHGPLVYEPDPESSLAFNKPRNMHAGTSE